MNTLICSRRDTPATALDLSTLLGSAAWGRLPDAVQRRFAADHGAAKYIGRMDLRCSGLGRLLAWLALPLRSPLVPHCIDDVPTEVQVSPDGHGGVVWSRRMGDHTVRSVKSVHAEGGVLERTTGGLAMALDVFVDEGALVFQSRHYAWCWGRVCIRLPQFLSPGVCRVEHRDLGAGSFRFTLAMTHPLYGETFHQTGVFTDPAEEI